MNNFILQILPNTFFRFKQFTVRHDHCAMKVTTDACLFGAWIAKEITKKQSVHCQMLDIGAGTGLLSLMVAQKCDCSIEAVEIDSFCATQANENIEASPFNEKIKAVHIDVLQWQTSTKYEYIFSNPPFYEKEIASSSKTKNVAHHGEGLKLEELLQFIKKHLTEKGKFFLLFPAKRDKELISLLKKNNLSIQQKILMQQTLKHSPFRLMIQGCFNEVERLPDETISIKDEANNYTPAFSNLLKDYYLYL